MAHVQAAQLQPAHSSHSCHSGAPAQPPRQAGSVTGMHAEGHSCLDGAAVLEHDFQLPVACQRLCDGIGRSERGSHVSLPAALKRGCEAQGAGQGGVQAHATHDGSTASTAGRCHSPQCHRRRR